MTGDPIVDEVHEVRAKLPCKRVDVSSHFRAPLREPDFQVVTVDHQTNGSLVGALAHAYQELPKLFNMCIK